MFIDELQKIVNERLNINYVNECVNLSKFEYLKSIDDSIDSIECSDDLILPNKLILDVEKIFKKAFENYSKTIIKNRIEQGLFFVSLIFNDLYFSDDIEFKRVFKSGVPICKDMIINFISIKNYYEIKNVLLKNEIISEIDMILPDKRIQYSKTFKLSKQYVLNESYKYKIKLIRKPNKYVSKFLVFKKHSLLFGNKQKSFKNNFLPFDNDQKNLQYLYQKQMFFDESFFDELEKNIPDYRDYLDDYKSKIGKEVKKLLAFHKALNSHVFSSSEAYGRIYLPFHYIPSEYRKCIRIGNNEKLFETFDIKCCFVFLSAQIIKNETNDVDLKEECNKIIELTRNDIYKEILEYNGLSCTNSKRAKLKSLVMKWLFSNLQDRRFIMASSIDMQYIDLYFKNTFPLFYSKIVFYKTRSFYSLNDDNNIVKTEKSDLSYSCFEYESNIMFNKILPSLNTKFEKIPFISLHDAIFIPERFKNMKKRIKNAIISMMNELE
jgi:hypothetical protein